MEWLVCLRSPAPSLKSSCGTELIKYSGEVDFSIGIDEEHVCVGLDEKHVSVGVDELHVCSESTWTWSW